MKALLYGLKAIYEELWFDNFPSVAPDITFQADKSNNLFR